jgi:hypothetical protein
MYVQMTKVVGKARAVETFWGRGAVVRWGHRKNLVYLYNGKLK